MKRAAIFAAAALSFGGAHANDIDFNVDNFSQEGRIVSAVLKLTNNLEQAVSGVFVACAFLDENKKAVDIGNDIVSRIDAKGHAYGKASIVTGRKIGFVDCRITNFDR